MDLTQITLKIGSSGLSSTNFQDFRRYGYTIISGHEDDTFLRTLKERSAYLDNYLNLISDKTNSNENSCLWPPL